MVLKESTPKSVPMIFPTPPVSMVPPMIEDAMAFISIPMAWEAEPDPTWRKYTNPPIPANKLQSNIIQKDENRRIYHIHPHEYNIYRVKHIHNHHFSI